MRRSFLWRAQRRHGSRVAAFYCACNEIVMKMTYYQSRSEVIMPMMRRGGDIMKSFKRHFSKVGLSWLKAGEAMKLMLLNCIHAIAAGICGRPCASKWGGDDILVIISRQSAWYDRKYDASGVTLQARARAHLPEASYYWSQRMTCAAYCHIFLEQWCHMKRNKINFICPFNANALDIILIEDKEVMMIVEMLPSLPLSSVCLTAVCEGRRNFYIILAAVAWLIGAPRLCTEVSMS